MIITTLLQVIEHNEIINATLIPKHIGADDITYQNIINALLHEYKIVYPNHQITLTTKEYQNDGYPAIKPKLNSCTSRLIVKLNNNESLAIYINNIDSVRTLIYNLDADISIPIPYLSQIKQKLNEFKQLNRLDNVSEWINDLSVDELINNEWITKYHYNNYTLEPIDLPSVKPTYHFTPK